MARRPQIKFTPSAKTEVQLEWLRLHYSADGNLSGIVRAAIDTLYKKAHKEGKHGR